MGDKSARKSSPKTAASKTLKEKRLAKADKPSDKPEQKKTTATSAERRDGSVVMSENI